MEIEIANEENESGKIIVVTKGCILCNFFGENPRSSDFVLKDGL